MDMKDEIRSYILNEFLPGVDESELSNTTALISGGIIDSIGTLKLISFMEEEYDIIIEAFEINEDNLDTLEKIEEFVESKK